jgi:glycine/D-amino acid oxidase-like deaminating enzyme
LKSFFIPNGNALFTEKLASAIQQAGHEIRLEHTIQSVNGRRLTTQHGSEEFDAIIFAQPVADKLYNSILPDQLPSAIYTHYYTLTIHCDRTPRANEQTDWGAIFYLPNKDPYQVTSVVNLANLYGQELNGYLNLNIVIRNTQSPTDTNESASHIIEQLSPALSELFPDVEIQNIAATVHWSQTMPCVTEELIEYARNNQGQHGYYFAGDWLGAPSMETALRSGVLAAQALQARLT